MSRVIPFIYVKYAEEAIATYIKAFHAHLDKPLVTYEHSHKIQHASLVMFGDHIFIADTQDNIEQHMFLTIECPHQEDVVRAFEILKEDADIHMPIIFESDPSTYAFSLKDKFGVSFLVYQR